MLSEESGLLRSPAVHASSGSRISLLASCILSGVGLCFTSPATAQKHADVKAADAVVSAVKNNMERATNSLINSELNRALNEQVLKNYVPAPPASTLKEGYKRQIKDAVKDGQLGNWMGCATYRAWKPNSHICLDPSNKEEMKQIKVEAIDSQLGAVSSQGTEASISALAAAKGISLDEARQLELGRQKELARRRDVLQPVPHVESEAGTHAAAAALSAARGLSYDEALQIERARAAGAKQAAQENYEMIKAPVSEKSAEAELEELLQSMEHKQSAYTISLDRMQSAGGTLMRRVDNASAAAQSGVTAAREAGSSAMINAMSAQQAQNQALLQRRSVENSPLFREGAQQDASALFQDAIQGRDVGDLGGRINGMLTDRGRAVVGPVPSSSPYRRCSAPDKNCTVR